MSSPTSKSTAGIGPRAMSGGMMILAGKFLVKSIDVLVLMVVARLLAQEAFGLIGLAMTFVVVVEAVLDIGLNTVLLKEKEITNPMLDTVFTLSVMRGFLLAVLLCSMAVPVGMIYDQPRLPALICALSMAPAFRGACSPALIFYIRRMDFRWEILLELIGKLVGGAACIGVAMATGSYWALVAAVVIPPLVMNLVSFRVAPYRPRFSLSEWHRFSNFTRWMTATQIASAISWQIDKFLLGNFLSPACFGKYSVAKDLSNTSQQAIAPAVSKTLGSASSEAHHREAHTLGLFYIKACSAILTLVGPVFLGLALLSDHVVLIVLGPEWSESGWILKWFSLAAIFDSLNRTVDSLALILNRNRSVAILRMIAISFRAPLVWLGCLMYSYQGAIAALVLTSITDCLLMSNLGCRLTNVRTLDLFRAFRRPAVMLIVMGFVLALLKPDHQGDVEIFPLMIKCAMAGIVAVAAYGTGLLALWRLEGSPVGLERQVLELVAGLGDRFLKLKRAP